MQLEIVTPEKILYQGDVDQITLNTSTGKISVLPHHVNLFTKVEPGELLIKIENHEQYMAITGGFLEVSNNKVTILADYAVHADDIDVDKALEAQKRAEALLKKKEENLSEQDFAEARAELSRAILELHIANRRRHRKS
jgi:F-type H+-transporting ATPase subunit epsilon